MGISTPPFQTVGIEIAETTTPSAGKNSIPLLNLCGINACRDTYVTLGPNLNLDAVKG